MFARTRIRVQTHTSGVSLTEQKWRDRQDVNSIVARCLRGDTSGLKTCGFNYADISSTPDTLQEFLNSRIQAERYYDSLPSEAKKRWKTPSDFVEACSNETEREYFERFGLLKAKEVDDSPVKVQVVNPVTEPVTPNGAA